MTDQPIEAAQGEVDPAAGRDAPPVVEAPPSAHGKGEENLALAILQETVKAAEKEAASKEASAPVPPPERKRVSAMEPPSGSRRLSWPAQAAGLAVALGLGVASGWSASVLWTAAPRTEPKPVASSAAAPVMVDRSGAAFGIRRPEVDSVRLAAEVRGLKASLDSLKEAVERTRQDQVGRLAQVGEKLDRASRAEQEAAQKYASLAERLERESAAGKQAAERLDRIEQQVGSAVALKAASVTAEGPAQTGSIPEQKPKPAVVDGWILRDVDDGLALIEGRNHRLLEIARGDTIPGGGRVESIERRGRGWIVVTSRGIIAPQP